ncbi:thiopeptide-type bacteriocin biosynthesis protein [uncultured Flavobacterium sp.]|uniref:thiopeptide-type bacteriocin biosynthesis protein n=1 Tax=uncultured Flavobacterium sp. TaxID=165435 RepID=UPI0030C7A134
MQREFNIGSEWLYYKIYCGVKTADIILLEHLNKKIKFLKENKIIKKWFFIRYNDPENHIRLRFLLFKNSNLNEVTKILQQTFEELQSQNIIWKIQTDTYVRELERYGVSTYEETETIFETDSALMLNYLSLKNQFSNETTILLFSFLAIDSFLNLFELSNLEKLNLLNSMQLSFKLEFNADKNLKKELDKHYRELSNEIELVLEKDKEEYFQLFEKIDCKSNKLKGSIPILIENLEVDIFSYLNSQIHMMINRQYTSRQREYELIIYDHLHRFYKTQFFKS